MADIVIKMPGKRAPGHLRRQRESLEIQERLRVNPTTADFDASIAWLLRTAVEVIVPDGVDPVDALLDLSEDEFNELMAAARGEEAAVDPPNGG